MTILQFSLAHDQPNEIIQAVMSTPEVTAASSAAFALQLAIEEVVVNVANYAYPAGQQGELSITTALAEDSIVITFADRGAPFNPLTQAAPDLSLSVEERPIGGLGILLVKELMDTTHYRFDNGCNILTITKNLSNP